MAQGKSKKVKKVAKPKKAPSKAGKTSKNKAAEPKKKKTSKTDKVSKTVKKTKTSQPAKKETSKAKTVKPKATKAKVKKTKVAKAKTTKTKTIKAKTTKAKATKAKTTKVKTTKAKTTKAKTTKAKTTKAKSLKPKAVAAKSKKPAKKKTKKKAVPAKKEFNPLHTSLTEGKPAPKFKLTSTTGVDISLESFRNSQTVVLYFYPKDDTPGCTIEGKEFHDLKVKFTRHKAIILGISPDDIESHIAFSEKYGFKLLLLADLGSKVAKKYDVWKEKSIFGKKFMAVERTTFVIGNDGKIKKIFTDIKVKGHAKDVLKAVKNLDK